jgi:hypothetical protein
MKQLFVGALLLISSPFLLHAANESGLQPIYESQQGDTQSFRLENAERIKEAGTQLEIAEALRLRDINPSDFQSLSFEGCLALNKEIEAAYPHSPFLLQGANFSNHSSICIHDNSLPEEFWSHQGLKFFKAEENIPTALGENSRKQLLVVNELANYPYVAFKTLYLLSDKNQILEVRTDLYANEKLRTKQVDALDRAGNFYSKSFDEKHVSRPWNVYRFSSVDGRTSHAIKTERFRREDSGFGQEWLETYHMKFATKVDWSEVFLPITFGWLGASYRYASGFYDHSKHFDSSHFVFKDKKEVCFEGDRRDYDKWYFYVNEGTERYSCFNKW